MNYNSIGKNIKELRIKYKMSQDELASKLYVSRQAISNWECSKTYPDIDNIKMLSEIFNVTVEDIIIGNNKDDKACEKLYSETIKIKTKVRKLVIMVSLLVILLLFSILFYFFLDNYKQVRVYRVDAGNGLIQDGLFVVTKESWHLKLGSIKTSKDIKSVRLYLLINDKEEIICDGLTDDYTLSENIGYNELFRFSEKDTINNFYIEVIYKNGDKDNYKVEFQLKYENSKIFSKKETDISDTGEYNDPIVLNILQERMTQNFVKTTDRKYTYKFKYNGEEFEAEYIDYPGLLTIYNYKKNYRFSLNSESQNIIDYRIIGKDKNDYSCSIKLNNIKYNPKVMCDDKLTQNILNIYDSLLKEIDAL